MKELFEPQYESFQTVNIEAFNDHGYATALAAKNLADQNSAVRAMGQDYANNIQEQNDNYGLLNANVNSLASLRSANIDRINTHENSVVANLKPGMKPTGDNILQKAREEDSNIIVLQQNYLYILGTITFAIVAVGAAVISRN